MTAADVPTFPKLTATRGDPSRLQRLAEVFDQAVAQLGATMPGGLESARKSLIGRLEQLDDDRDDLTVLWTSEPTAAERNAIEKSWKAGQVHHLIEPSAAEW